MLKMISIAALGALEAAFAPLAELVLVPYMTLARALGFAICRKRRSARAGGLEFACVLAQPARFSS